MSGTAPFADIPFAGTPGGSSPTADIEFVELPEYTYTRDLPYTSADLNNREKYRLPRSILLPPYLASNPYFVEFTDAIDSVFDTIEDQTEALRNLRNMWVTSKQLELKSQEKLMIDFVDWGGPDRITVIQQVNLLGMRISNTGLIAEQGFRALAKFVGRFWFEKGTRSVIDFLNFCLGTDMTIVNCWTQDYVTFVPEGDPSIGSKIWDTPPGPWYPTTHVNVSYPADAAANDPNEILKFLYEVINYNIVVNLISSNYDLYFSGDNQVYVAFALEAREWGTFVTPSYPQPYI